MKGRISLIVILGIGFAAIGLGITACTGERVTGSNQASGESFSMVVRMAGKELTIDAPRLGPNTISGGEGVVTVMIKNSGQTAIALAEIELTYWDQYYEGEEYSDRVQVRNLGPEEVQTIVWQPPVVLHKGSLRIRVTKIE